MLVALFVFAVAAAVPLSPPGAGLDSEQTQPSTEAEQRYREGTTDNTSVLTTSGSLAVIEADHSLPDPRTTTKHRGADLCDGCKYPAAPAVGASEFKNVRKRNNISAVFLEFIGIFRSRRSSETPLPTRDKHLSPIHTPALTGLDVGPAFGILQNVHLFHEKELRPPKASQNSSQSPLEDSVSASSGGGLFSPSSITEEERGDQPKAGSTTEALSSPLISSTHQWKMTSRDAGNAPTDTSIFSHDSKSQKVEPNASAGRVTDENTTLSYNEYRSNGQSNGEIRKMAEQVVFTDTKSTSLASGNADATVVEVQISKSEMAVEKETEEIIIRDTTLIIVFSCLAVLVIIVCKIIRYIMDYKLSKYEERMQNTGARPPC